jgi:hypothetical protein
LPTRVLIGCGCFPRRTAVRALLTCQAFFARDMGLPLTMTPNYDDFSCQFAFGRTPGPQAADEAFATPCFQQCPTKKPAAGQAQQCHKVAPGPL